MINAWRQQPSNRREAGLPRSSELKRKRTGASVFHQSGKHDGKLKSQSASSVAREKSINSATTSNCSASNGNNSRREAEAGCEQRLLLQRGRCRSCGLRSGRQQFPQEMRNKERHSRFYPSAGKKLFHLLHCTTVHSSQWKNHHLCFSAWLLQATALL